MGKGTEKTATQEGALLQRRVETIVDGWVWLDLEKRVRGFRETKESMQGMRPRLLTMVTLGCQAKDLRLG